MSVGYPWDVLGMDQPGDRRAIKRAYASRLKSCRPEDDAAGFAALRQAYELALSWQEDTRPEVATPIMPWWPAQAAPPPAEPAIDLEAKARAILGGAEAPQALARTLAEDRDLWNLADKDQLSALLARHVADDPRAVPLRTIAVLSAFFHWDDVSTRARFSRLEIMVDRLDQLLQAAQLSETLEKGDKTLPLMVRRLWRWGAGPLACAYALNWRGVERARAALHVFPPLVRERVFGQETLDFWEGLDHASWRRFLVILLRLDLLVVALALIVRFPGRANVSFMSFLEACAIPLMVLNGVALTWRGFKLTWEWGELPLDTPVPPSWSAGSRRWGGLTALAALAAIAALSPADGEIALTLAVALSSALTIIIINSPLLWCVSVFWALTATATWPIGTTRMPAIIPTVVMGHWWLTIPMAVAVLATTHIMVHQLPSHWRLRLVKRVSGALTATIVLWVGWGIVQAL